MTHYIVHIYREMRLSYADIEADTPEAAAAITRDRPTSDADDIEDCEGETLAALVDLAGDEDYSQSVTVDFEPERQRKAAPALLAALEAVLPYAESEHASLFECWRRDGESASELEAERCAAAIDKATVAIAEAKTAGIPSDPVPARQPSRFEIEHDPQENPDRAYVLVDGTFDVAIIRTVEGIVIDVYPKDWIDPIDTMTVRDEEVAAASAEAEADAAGGIDMDEDIVIFRRFPDGDIIALFPCLPAECLTAWPCQSYMHVGQHGAADPRIVHDTRPAKPREYTSLKAELERIGYRLIVRRRVPTDAYARRKAWMAAIFPSFSPWEDDCG